MAYYVNMSTVNFLLKRHLSFGNLTTSFFVTKLITIDIKQWAYVEYAYCTKANAHERKQISISSYREFPAREE